MAKSKGRRLAEWLRNLDSNSKATKDTIANSSIDSTKLEDDAVTNAKIADGAVHTANIADTGVTFGKLHTALVVTESDGIGNNDNDTTVATSAAIKDYVDTAVAGKDNTDEITEGSTNLYFTNERVDDRVNSLLTAGTGITLTYDDTANTLTVAGAAQYGDSDVGSYLSTNGYATQSTIVAAITDSAPVTLNTLNELAAALGDDANFSTTTATSLGNRLRIDVSNQGLTGAQKTNALTNLGITATVAELNYVDGVTSNIQTQLNAKGTSSFSGAYADLTGKPTIPTNNNQLTNGAGYITSFDITTQTDSKYLRSDIDDQMLAQLYGGFGAVSTGGTTDWNHSTNARSGGGYTLLTGNASNGPGGSVYYHPFSFEYSSKNGTGNITQLAIPYNGFSIWQRYRYSSSWSGWVQQWNSANDGSGSGLDADTVDGLQAASFLRSDASDVTSGNLQVTGATYGGISIGEANTNYDSWDRQLNIHGSGHARVNVKTANVRMGIYAHDSWQGGTMGHVGTYTNHQLSFICNTNQRAVLTTGGSLSTTVQGTLWGATNDGSGSGLDADLLDGQHGSYYAPVSTAVTLAGTQTITGTKTFESTSQAPLRLHVTNSNGSWDALTFQGTNEWGDNLNYGVLGGDGTQGIMLRRPHVVWSSGTSSADIRLGKSGGTSSGTWVNMGVKTGNLGFLGAQDTNVLTWDTSYNVNIPSGNLTRASNTVWDAGNDGSGSGLDADTLDGIDSTSFLRSDAADTFTGDLTTGANNHITFGPNSTWASYLRIGGNGRTVTTSNAWASIVTTNGNIHIDPGTSRTLYLNYYSGTSGTAFGNGGGSAVAWMGNDGDLWKGSGDNAGSKYWHAGNDGSGSGLDADTLDGLQASNLARSDASWSSGSAWRQTFFSGSGGVTFGSNHYSMGIDYANGAWSNPNYSDLIIGYHTGIRLGAAYSGIRFYNNSPTTDANNDGQGDQGEALLMTIGGGGSGSSGAHVYINNSLYIKNGTSTNNIAWNAGNDGSGSGLDADLLDGLQLHTGRNNEANKVVRTDASGYIQAGWLNTTSGDSGIANDVARIYCSYDNYIRYLGKSDFKVLMGLSKDTYDRRDYSSNTYYHTGVNSHGAYNMNDLFNRGSGFIDTWGSPAGRPPSGTHFNGFQALHYSASTTYHHGMQMVMSAGNPSYTYLRGWWANGGSGFAWQKIWTDGNDGSGSGLDADTVDGIQASSILQLSGTQTVSGIKYFTANQNTTGSNPPLQVYGTTSGAIMSFHRGGYFAVNFGLDSDNVMRIGGWSASANRWQLDMSGNMTAAGNVSAYSDIRLKENIKVIPNALEKVKQLRGVTFTRNDQEDKEARHTGVIAQEVEKVLPEVISEDNEGIKNVAYGNMVGLLIEAIKELKQEVDDLKTQLKEK